MSHETPFSITYEGFKPDEAFEGTVKQHLNDVLNYCPYGSFIKARIAAAGSAAGAESAPSKYIFELNVWYVNGQLNGFGEGRTPDESLVDAEKSLYRKIEAWRLDRFGAKARQLARTRAKDGSKINILVVDDDPISIKRLEVVLRREGAEVEHATSGAAAVEAMKKKKFDLVVMDWNMEPLNGRETLTLLDAEMSWDDNLNFGSRMPIITYSVSDEDQVRFPPSRNLYQIGYLPKGMPYKSLMETTKKFLKDVYTSLHYGIA